MCSECISRRYGSSIAARRALHAHTERLSVSGYETLMAKFRVKCDEYSDTKVALETAKERLERTVLRR